MAADAARILARVRARRAAGLGDPLVRSGEVLRHRASGEPARAAERSYLLYAMTLGILGSALLIGSGKVFWLMVALTGITVLGTLSCGIAFFVSGGLEGFIESRLQHDAAAAMHGGGLGPHTMHGHGRWRVGGVH